MDINMDKSRKLLAARRRLKEFQQNKNHIQDSVPAQQKDQKKTSPAEVSPGIIESSSNTDINSVHSPEKRSPEIVETLRKDSEISNNPNLINLTDSISGSPSYHSRLAREPPDLKSYFDQSPEFDVTETLPERENTPESSANTRRLVDPQTIQDTARYVTERDLPLPPASPSPPRLINFSENEPNDSPSSQKDHLLKMASAVADALIDSSECISTTPQDTDHEYRNQFLTSCLQEQKQSVSQLNVQVSQYSSKISELEAILATRDAEFEAKLLREVNPLKEQLLVHAQTTGILVGEKAELTAAIDQCRTIAQRKSEEVVELNGRLKVTQCRIVELEKELSHVRNIVDDTRKMYQQLHLDYAELDKRYNDLRRSKDDDELESSELRQELSLKNAENLSLQRELDEKNTLLSLNDLKIQQLTSSPQEIQAIEGQHQTMIVMEQQLSQSREALKSVSREKDEAAKQYENYVRQLDSRHETTVKELEESLRKIQAMENREKSYVERLSDLEQSLQREKQRVEELLPMQSHVDRIEHLTKSLDAISLEHANLQTILNERDTEIEVLKRDLEESRERNEDSVEKSKLVSALESEQLGASRAVSQNQQLKLQLNEMHDAFVTLSNSKLDLTEQLQAERTIGKKLNARLNKVEEEMDELREELRVKKIELDDMEREKLQNAQIADQMNHYQAQSHQARTLQQELQNSLGCMEILRRENQQLTTRLNELREEEIREDALSNGDDCPEEEKNGEKVRKKLPRASMIPDPLKKLEIRFKETMERVAELTDDKQRLEHLVLQLQGETETIGEYITLYQKQRAILQRKAGERDEMFRQLVEQRNHQQEQLHQLKVLVADLLNRKLSSTVETVTKSSSIIEPDDDAQLSQNHDNDPKRDTTVEDFIDVKDKTTSKILDLLTEIKDCNDTSILEPNFHPCPWCSGKLITV